MFGLVREARLERMEAEVRVLKSIAEEFAVQLLSLSQARDRVGAESIAMSQDNARLRAELAQTWIRNTRGHWERHPSAGK